MPQSRGYLEACSPSIKKKKLNILRSVLVQKRRGKGRKGERRRGKGGKGKRRRRKGGGRHSPISIYNSIQPKANRLPVFFCVLLGLVITELQGYMCANPLGNQLEGDLSASVTVISPHIPSKGSCRSCNTRPQPFQEHARILGILVTIPQYPECE